MASRWWWLPWTYGVVPVAMEGIALDVEGGHFGIADLDAFWVKVLVDVAGDGEAGLVLDALDMALGQRRPSDVGHHSDQGSQYTSIAFGARCRQAGVRPSMGSVGDCYDNAMCESFFATLECELFDRHRFRSQAEARTTVFEFIEGWYNPRRRHSAIGYLSPIDYERSELPPARPSP